MLEVIIFTWMTIFTIDVPIVIKGMKRYWVKMSHFWIHSFLLDAVKALKVVKDMIWSVASGLQAVAAPMPKTWKYCLVICVVDTLI